MNQFAALLGVLHQAARGQRGLVPAAGSLEQLPGAVADNMVRIVVAARTAEATRPTRGLQHLGAMRLGAKAAKELRQGQAGLKLHSVERHGVGSVFGCTQITRPVAHQMSLAEAGFQSGRRMEVIWCDLLNPLLHVRLESK